MPTPESTAVKVLNVDTLQRGYTKGKTRNTSPISANRTNRGSASEKTTRQKQPAESSSSTPRPKTAKRGTRKGRRKSSASSRRAAPKSPSMIEQLRIERYERIRHTVHNHSEEEVKEFLIQILGKLPGVILDLSPYPHLSVKNRRSAPLAEADDSENNCDTIDGGYAQKTSQGETTFVDKLCQVLKEYKSIDT